MFLNNFWMDKSMSKPSQEQKISLTSYKWSSSLFQFSFRKKSYRWPLPGPISKKKSDLLSTKSSYTLQISFKAPLQSSHMGYEIVRNNLRIFEGYWLLTKEFVGEVVISRIEWGEGKVGGWDLRRGRFWRKDHWVRLGTLKSLMVCPDGIKKQNKCKTVGRTGRMTKPQKKISEPSFGGTKNYDVLADLQCYEHYGWEESQGVA